MFDVGQQQFLMLLLVVKAKRDELVQLDVVRMLTQHRQHAFIDSFPVSHHTSQRGATDQSALCAWVLVSYTDVVAVEQHAKTCIKRLEVGLILFKNEGFKKPGQVGQMPFGRAGVRHGLQLAIFCAKRLGQCLALHANALKTQCKGWETLGYGLQVRHVVLNK